MGFERTIMNMHHGVFLGERSLGLKTSRGNELVKKKVPGKP
jgi:hypothetical protein